jgi:hypothetical protein
MISIDSYWWWLQPGWLTSIVALFQFAGGCKWLKKPCSLTALVVRLQKIYRKIQDGNCLNRHPTWAHMQAKHEWHASCMRADRHSKYLLVPFPYRYVDYMWTPGGLQVDSTWTPWTLRCYRCTNTWTPPGVCLDSRYTPQNSMDAPWSPPQPVAQYNDLPPLYVPS